MSELASAQNARDRNGAALSFLSPMRLIVACAVTLALIVVTSAGLIVYNLRARAVSENAQALSNSALIVAKQIEQAFTAVQAVERRFHDDLSGLPVIDSESIEREYRRHAIHVKLRDKAGGMVVGPEWCGSNRAPYEHDTRPADPQAM